MSDAFEFESDKVRTLNCISDARNILYTISLAMDTHSFLSYGYTRGGADPKSLGINMVYGRAVGATT